jgi:hypothetical protein
VHASISVDNSTPAVRARVGLRTVSVLGGVLGMLTTYP